MALRYTFRSLTPTGNDNDETETAAAITAASVLDYAVQAFSDALCDGLQRAGLHQPAHSISSRLLAGDIEALLQAALEHPENKR